MDTSNDATTATAADVAGRIRVAFNDYAEQYCEDPQPERTVLRWHAKNLAELAADVIGDVPAGKTSWLYNATLGIHVPCCSRRPDGRFCLNGPLTADQVAAGDCGEHSDAEDRLH